MLNTNTKRWIIILVMSGFFAAAILTPVPPASAMGQAPATCPDRYDSTISSFYVIYNGETTDVLAHPNSTISVPANDSFTVSFTLLVANVSSEGNTGNGSTWFNTNEPGYYLGTCVYNVSATNNKATVNIAESRGGISPSVVDQQIEYSTDYGSWTARNVYFTIHWTGLTTPTASSTVSSANTTAPTSSHSTTPTTSNEETQTLTTASSATVVDSQSSITSSGTPSSSFSSSPASTAPHLIAASVSTASTTSASSAASSTTVPVGTSNGADQTYPLSLFLGITAASVVVAVAVIALAKKL